MCAIFGYVARDGKPIDLPTLKRIARANVRRGPHAWGLAWIDARGRLRMFKQTGDITDSLGLLAMARGATQLVGHVRYATHGEPENNLNNHPHAADGGWLVHNGVVGNYREIVRAQSLHTISECDSEVLGHLIERDESDDIVTRCWSAADQTTGPLAMLGLWREHGVVAVRRGNPLHVGTCQSGYWLATLSGGLPGRVTEFDDDSADVFVREA